MSPFNLTGIMAFALLGLVSTFPQQTRYVRMASANKDDSSSAFPQQTRYVRMASANSDDSPSDGQLSPSTSARASLDAQQLKQSAVLGGPARLLPAITRLKTNPASLLKSTNPSKAKQEILIDLYEHQPEQPKRKFPTYIDLMDENDKVWGAESETARSGNASDSSNGNDEGENNSQDGVDASSHSENTESSSTGNDDPSQSTSGSGANDQQADEYGAENQEKDKSEGQQDAEPPRSYAEKYNAAKPPKYSFDDFEIPNDRRAPAVVPTSETASYLKAFGSRPDNFRRPAMKASANFAEQGSYGDYDFSSTPHMLQLISSQQTELKELLVQIMYRQTTLRDDVHKIDQQLTHIQQGVVMPRSSYNMHSYSTIPSYRLG